MSSAIPELPGLATSYPELAPLVDLGARAQAGFAAASTELELRTELAKFIGKKGELQAAMSLMKALAPADRPKLGAVVNAIKVEVEAHFDGRLRAIEQAALDADLKGRPFDLSLPGRLSLGRGHEHPVMRVREELLGIFRDLGFVSVDGPEIELEENNFTRLAFPPDHPATDMQDTFWLGPEVLLRTHTSNVQSREMARGKPPMAIVSAGAVYRRDDDMTHSPMFHQVEGFLLGEKVSLAHLRGVLTAFAERLYGPGTPTRFRPSYFPFVEPGAEVDVGCVFCRVEDGSRTSCRVCKATGWLEIGGCGMVHPDVFRSAGIDPETTTGFAFGMGIERIAMLRYGIPNIRLVFENDPRFLDQF
jgi:phenylalanyl-tRNA synthetase alpha chain